VGGGGSAGAGRPGSGGAAGEGGGSATDAGAGGDEAAGAGGEESPAGTGGSGIAGTATGGAGAFGRGTYRDLILADGPIAYWRMGPTSGAVVADEVGDNDLVFQGAGHTLGVEGAIPGDPDGALGFDGTSSFAVANHARAFDFAGAAAFTLECWARHEPGGADYFQHLISNTEGSPGARNGYILYLLPEAADGDAAVSSFELDRVGAEISVWGPAPEDSVWTHYAAASDGSMVTLYVAGTQVDSRAIDGAMTPRSGPFAVGRASSEDARYFKGVIDEVAVYPRALGIGEIVSHATFGRVLQP
jgi:hypothetical protein